MHLLQQIHRSSINSMSKLECGYGLFARVEQPLKACVNVPYSNILKLVLVLKA